MSEFYVYPLALPVYEGLLQSFPDLLRRNEEFQVITERYWGWLDPPEFENRRRIVLDPPNGRIFLLAKTGRPDWEIAGWLSRNELPTPPPTMVYLW